MAGPGRRDDSPKDFAFLSSDVKPPDSSEMIEKESALVAEEAVFTESQVTESQVTESQVTESQVTESQVAESQEGEASVVSESNAVFAFQQFNDAGILPNTAPRVATEAPDLTAQAAVLTTTPAEELSKTGRSTPAVASLVASAASQVAASSIESAESAICGSAIFGSAVGRKGTSSIVVGYAIAVTMLLAFLLITGRLTLSGNAGLESLPDLRPLAPNEFQRVPDETPVPDGHVLHLGESRRFGDVLVTPIKVTREPLTFKGFLSGASEESLTTQPLLKLWLRFENQSGSYGFPPFDVGLMSHRTPPFSTDESTIANSFLTVSPSAATKGVRILNFFQTVDDTFVITGQESGKVINPNESLETFIVCSDQIESITTTDDSAFTWRIQFRKGVHQSSGNGVTTLVDVSFSGSEISDITAASVKL